MNTTILSYRDCGPYYRPDREQLQASSLADFVGHVRTLFVDDRVDAVAVVKNGTPIALWLAEPDIDCDSDGLYEVKPAYPGQEYVRYTKESKGFSNLVANYFGSQLVLRSTTDASSPD